MRVLAVTSVRNEGPYLLEWIAHHRAAGVSDFLVFSNDCDDGTDALLDALQVAGVVTHVPQERQGNKSIQWQALTAAWKHPIRKQADWILVSDVDEFLNIHVPGYRLADLLASVPQDTDGIVIPWRLYGHNDVLGIEDQPVTEQFTRAIPGDVTFPVSAGFFKTLFRTKGPFNRLGVHRPRQKPEERAGLPRFVDGSGQSLPSSFTRNQKRLSLFGVSNGRALVEMNHYAVRSAGAFLNKGARGLPNRTKKQIDLAYWVERNFNTVEDLSIAQMRPATHRALETLLQIDEVAALHDHAVLWHRTQFSALVREPASHTLFTQILTASGSVVLPDRLQHQLVRWYQDVNKKIT